MPGKLRHRRQRPEGYMLRETEEHNSLLLLEAASHAAGLPGASDLAHELIAQDYFEASIVEQWRIIGRSLLEHSQEAEDPLKPAISLSCHPEIKVRFHSCALISSLLLHSPKLALQKLYPLACDEDRRIGEAVQAFGVRPLAQEYGPELLPLLEHWLVDENPNARRACVEACRPRGMWVSQLKWALDSPALLLPMLEQLRFDEEAYPANAVGNCFNDIAKNNPKMVLDVLSTWMQEVNPGPWLDRIVQKGIRTLIKNGDPSAMRLCGLGELQVKVSGAVAGAANIRPNSALEFNLTIDNSSDAADAKLVYEISTTGKKEGRPRRSRFQGKNLRLPQKDKLTVRCRERIYDQKSAKLIAGPGAIRCWLNGIEVLKLDFQLRR